MAVNGRKKPVKQQLPATVDVWPHPLTEEGRRTVLAREGLTVAEILREAKWGSRPVDAWIDGVQVPAELLPARQVRAGEIVTLRAGVRGGGGRKILRQLLTIAVVAASVFVGNLPAVAALGAFGSAAVSAGVLVVGSLLVNALVPPELPRLDDPGADRAAPVYSLSGGANRARQYAPLLMVLGRHRVFPDAATIEYTTFEDGEQFLHKIFDFGLGPDLEIGDLYSGPNLLTGFDGVTVYRTEAEIRRYIAGNVDTFAGAELTDTTPVTRAGIEALQVQVDFVGRIFRIDDEGETVGHTVRVGVGVSYDGGANWDDRTYDLTSDSQTQLRRTITRETSELSDGDWHPRDVTVRVWRTTAPVDKDADDVSKEDSRTYDDVAFTAVKIFQPDDADYTGRNRIGIRFKASAQLQGRLDRINAIAWQKVPTWDGNAWTAPRRTSNPAWITRWLARGYYQGGRLRAGWGLAATRIDDDVLIRWGAWCAANDLACNYVIDREQDVDAILRLVAKCGRASPSWQTGKYGVVFDQENQTPIGMIHPGNIIDGTFGVEWVDSKVADEVVVRYIEPEKDWQWNSIRRPVPDRDGNVDPDATPVETVTTTRHGIIDADQAAAEAGLLAAAHRFHKRRMDWEMSAEGLAIRRGNVVWINHSLVSGGTVGLLAGGTAAEVRLDHEVTLPAGDNWLMVRMADGTLHTSAVTAGSAPDRLVLTTPLPEAPDALGPEFDLLWRLYTSAKPPRKAKIIAVEYQGPTTVRLVAIDERPEYYAAANQGEVVSRTTHALPTILRLNAAKRWVKAGNVQVLQVEAVLTVAGPWEGGQVRVGRGTAESVRIVKELTGDDLVATWVEEPRGEISITAIPRYNGGLHLAGAVSIDEFDLVDGLYDIAPPTDFAVSALADGTRSFAWTPPPEPDLEGTVIKYLAIPENHQGAFEPAWGAMSFLHDGVLTASPFETSRIGAGNWAFAARSRSTAGDLSAVVRTTRELAIGRVAGQVWLTGTGDPDDTVGNDGDFYLDTSSGNVWRKSAGSWAQVSNFQPADGAQWYFGTSAPQDSLGADGDWYLITGSSAAAGTIYTKVSGAWVEQLDIHPEDGSMILGGTAAPGASLGKVGDWYFRSSNGYVYRKTGSATWTFVRDITGPAGVAGTIWHSTAGPPSSGLGKNGDFALDVRNNDAYRKSSGTWTKVADFSGADGAQWYFGTSAPSNTLGKNGDWFLITGSVSSAGSVYRKSSGSWRFQVDIHGEEGSHIHGGAGAPTSAIGKVGDWYFRSSNGYVYEKVGSSSGGSLGNGWNFVHDLTGPQGDPATLGAGTVQTANIALSATAELYTAYDSGNSNMDGTATRSVSVTIPGGVGYQYIAQCVSSFFGTNQTVTLTMDGRSDAITQQSRFTHPAISVVTSGSVATGKTITATIDSNKTSGNWGVNYMSLFVFLAKR